MRPKTMSAGRKLCPLMGNTYSTDRLGNYFFRSACSIKMTFIFLFCPQKVTKQSEPVGSAGFSIQVDTQAVIKSRGNHVRVLFVFMLHPHIQVDIILVLSSLYHSALLHRRHTCTAVLNNILDPPVFLAKPSFASCQNKELKTASRIFRAYRRKHGSFCLPFLICHVRIFHFKFVVSTSSTGISSWMAKS